MNNFEKILLTVFFVELFVGGGGRLIDFGFLSIRQVLFIGLMLTFLYRIISQKAYRNLEVNTFFRLNPVSVGIYLLIGWFAISSIIGYLNGNALSDIITDFLRVSFFAAFFPLAYYISEKRFSKQRIITILKYSAFAVALFTVLIALLGKTVFSGNFQPYKMFLLSLMGDDLLFRPSYSVFYKSHFYVFVGLVLSLNAVLTKKFSMVDILNLILCPISIFWSETRGFLFALMVSVLMIMIIDIIIMSTPVKGFSGKIKAIFQNKQLVKKSIILLIITVSVPFLYQYMTLERFEKSSVEAGSDEINDTSASVRVDYLLYSKDLLLDHPEYLVWGKGYGTEIAGRVTGIETSFLDILVEQGGIGLAFWLFLCLLVYSNYYFSFRRGGSLQTSDISLLGIFMGVLLLTNINPFINNPIGIIFFLIVLVLSRHTREQTV
ncbi:hypothetical protein [Niallia endozanthoxylica]|uniref:O-antigen polymerase n=1 Tax=Niallia endozanthoxylica TaxID=2036016 RepID=A0A5J5H4H6_9BACI|nr:hypothetical protein [Niallia endozanthoxylica]KAA9015476.1 hypothetical protein F4V44_22740 [Niallia endozanthoxylica]